MAHYIDGYADRVNELLHVARAGGGLFYKQEIIEVPGLLTALLITYDNVKDDIREVHEQMTWDQFLERMSIVKPDWKTFDKGIMELFATSPEKTISGWERRTLYIIRGGRHPEQWSLDRAREDVIKFMIVARVGLGPLIQSEVERARERIPVGPTHFSEYEHHVRVVFNYLFQGDLGAGQAQSRTQPENEGLEIRDLIFANVSNNGFWKGLKDKYSASEIVVDAKNTDCVTRDDLRQLYCYLKPALGFWGFLVCRSEPSAAIAAFNRTLYQNFKQERGVLILCDDDLRRMTNLANLGTNPSDYLQQLMSRFARGV